MKRGNTLEASFVTESSAANYEQKGVEIKRPDVIVISSEDINASFAGSTSKGTLAATILISCVVVVAAVAVSVTAIVVATKRKRAEK